MIKLQSLQVYIYYAVCHDTGCISFRIGSVNRSVWYRC